MCVIEREREREERERDFKCASNRQQQRNPRIEFQIEFSFLARLKKDLRERESGKKGIKLKGNQTEREKRKSIFE